MDIEKELERKLKTRKIAIENLGLEQDLNSQSTGREEEFFMSDEEWQDIYNEACRNLTEADRLWKITGYFDIKSNRRVIGPTIVFCKKVVRKLLNIFLGWYINPMLEQQSLFNASIVNNLYKMKDLMIQSKEQNINLRSQQESLFRDKEYIFKQLNISCDLSLLKNNGIDYFDFENNFRGTREGVKENQSFYLSYFTEEKNDFVLDIGCGRGEFLELMHENGVCAKGIDVYNPFVQYCNDKGFQVELGDALTYLNSIPDCSLNGIFMSQVVEHLSADYILALIKISAKKLKKGKYFILDTPNPQSILTYVDFYIDLGHIKPVHYKTLEYLFLKENYASIERFDNPKTKFKNIVSGIAGDDITNRDEFNYGMGNLNDWLSSYQDYTLIARR